MTGFPSKERVHPATGEPIPRDLNGKEIEVCDNCGTNPIASNGVLCNQCFEQPDINGWYENELATTRRISSHRKRF